MAEKNKKAVQAKVVDSKKWESPFKVYPMIKHNVKKYFWTIFLFFAVYYVIYIVVAMIFKGKSGSVIVSLTNIILSAYLSVAVILTYINAFSDKVVSFADTIKSSNKFIGKYIILNIFITIISILSILALGIPAFFIIPRIIIAPFLLVKNDMSATDALKQSWEITRNQYGPLYLWFLQSILIGLLAFTIIGIPFAIYFIIVTGSIPIFWISNKKDLVSLK